MIDTMNARMGRVFAGLMVAFAAIVVLLTWWQVLDAPSLRDKDYNNQTAYYEQRISRGIIRSADGVVLARNRARQTRNGDKIFARRYPRGGLAAHAVGYSTYEKSRTGVERTFNDALTGSTRELAGILGKLQGDEFVRGDNLELTLDAKAQRIANEGLRAAGKPGALVALEPSTGKILALASNPTFDPNLADGDFDALSGGTDSPLVNRATQGRYQPGSTFKVITASAALEDGATPDTTFDGTCSFDAQGQTITNFGGACVGNHDLTYALTKSVNTTFAQLGEELGQAKLRAQMEAYGFFQTRLVDDLNSNEQFASGLYRSGKPLDPEEAVDSARVAIGQERLQVTPLQMATVAATIANGGTRMRPYLVERVSTPGGRTVYEGEPKEVGQAISATTAGYLTEMMQSVVREGTGTQAQIEGVDVAGKTGTADTGSGNQVWFICFAPAENPTVAIAVTVEGLPPGASYGGTVAAPIAKRVLESLL